MAQVTLLGTGAALSDAVRENTYLVVQGEHSSILVDCAGSPTQRLLRAGVALDTIDQLILTHHHPDHIYGLPVLLLDMWLAGRKKVLHVYGLAETLRAARAMMRAFQWERWLEHGFFPVQFHAVPKKENHRIFATAEFSVSATPAKHLVPSIGLRFDSITTHKSMVYSSDTIKCDPIAELACNATILIHESTTIVNPDIGHSSARQAGEQATQAGVKQLVLVHLPPDTPDDELHAAAAAAFGGKVVVGKDFGKIRF